MMKAKLWFEIVGETHKAVLMWTAFFYAPQTDCEKVAFLPLVEKRFHLY